MELNEKQCRLIIYLHIHNWCLVFIYRHIWMNCPLYLSYVTRKITRKWYTLVKLVMCHYEWMSQFNIHFNVNSFIATIWSILMRELNHVGNKNVAYKLWRRFETLKLRAQQWFLVEFRVYFHTMRKNKKCRFFIQFPRQIVHFHVNCQNSTFSNRVDCIFLTNKCINFSCCPTYSINDHLTQVIHHILM